MLPCVHLDRAHVHQKFTHFSNSAPHAVHQANPPEKKRKKNEQVHVMEKKEQAGFNTEHKDGQGKKIIAERRTLNRLKGYHQCQHPVSSDQSGENTNRGCGYQCILLQLETENHLSSFSFIIKSLDALIFSAMTRFTAKNCSSFCEIQTKKKWSLLT
jgi:hypothetical protein